eukprot:358114-Chlamydomonas_euryale.AAC.1
MPLDRAPSRARGCVAQPRRARSRPSPRSAAAKGCDQAAQRRGAGAGPSGLRTVPKVLFGGQLLETQTCMLRVWTRPETGGAGAAPGPEAKEHGSEHRYSALLR